MGIQDKIGILAGCIKLSDVIQLEIKEMKIQINNTLDERVRVRQEKCPHNYQDRVKTPQGTYCGKCGLRGK